MVTDGQESDKDYGMVAAAVLDPDNRMVARLNRPGKNGKRIHAEHAAIIGYTKQHGDIPEGSIILTTLSPCNEPMDERDGSSCTDLINRTVVKKVYCGYMDPTQTSDTRQFNLMETGNREIRIQCKEFADTFLDHVHENIDQVAGIGFNGKQFNFSIRDLIAKAKDYPIKKLNPKIFVKQLAGRHEDPEETLKRAQAAELKYPIIVVQDGDTFMIADGTHRVQKALMNKLPTINAHVIPVEDMAEFSKKSVDGAMSEGLEKEYLSQISNLSWKPVNRSVWNTIQDEGLDEEQDAPNHTDWVMASLTIDPKDAQALQAFDNDAVEDFNRFDINLKDRYPGLTDLINYDRGTVTIVKPINQGIDENFADGKNPQDKGDSKRYGVPTKASISTLRKFAKTHSGRAAQLAHWAANMKSGKRK